MSNSLIMAIAGSLHQNISSGGTTPSIVGTTSGHTTSGSTTIPLPSGCASGDLAVIATSRANTCTITPPSGSTDLLADFDFYTTTAIAHVYGYTLTSTDITNGFVSYSASSTANFYELVVLNSTAGTPSVDVTGAATIANPNNTHPITCDAVTLTTAAPNDVVLAFEIIALVSSASVTWSGPSGWTVVDEASANYAYKISVYSLTQPSPGATPDASATATATINTRGCGIQMAFKP